jgi:hypothetical protein
MILTIAFATFLGLLVWTVLPPILRALPPILAVGLLGAIAVCAGASFVAGNTFEGWLCVALVTGPALFHWLCAMQDERKLAPVRAAKALRHRRALRRDQFYDDLDALVERWARVRGVSIHGSAISYQFTLGDEFARERYRLERDYREDLAALSEPRSHDAIDGPGPWGQWPYQRAS